MITETRHTVATKEVVLRGGPSLVESDEKVNQILNHFNIAFLDFQIFRGGPPIFVL